MIPRPWYAQRIAAALRRSPITVLLGPRQAGKTTLARSIAGSRPSTYFDLESAPDRLRLQNPEVALGSLEGLVVLDEIQAMPELYPVLRVLAGRPPRSARFLVLSSASPTILRDASRGPRRSVRFVELSGLDLAEVGGDGLEDLWLRGGLPRSYLAGSDADSFAWRDAHVRALVERDRLPLGMQHVAMLAHHHGQVWNTAALARSLSLPDEAVSSCIAALTGACLLRQLQPWHGTAGKWQVRSPRVYFRDSGLLHSLLGLPDRAALLAHREVAASWEGFALEQVLAIVRPTEAYFWATHGGAALDLLFTHGGRRYGINVRYGEAPVAGPWLRAAVNDLRLEHLWVVHAGRHAYPLAERASAMPLAEAVTRLPRELG